MRVRVNVMVRVRVGLSFSLCTSGTTKQNKDLIEHKKLRKNSFKSLQPFCHTFDLDLGAERGDSESTSC